MLSIKGVSFPFRSSNIAGLDPPVSKVVAPFLISQCCNTAINPNAVNIVVAPFLISQCYNVDDIHMLRLRVVAPFLISQCYNFVGDG